jgi:hypothetical protein
MDSRNCQTFYASPAKPGELLKKLESKDAIPRSSGQIGEKAPSYNAAQNDLGQSRRMAETGRQQSQMQEAAGSQGKDPGNYLGFLPKKSPQSDTGRV